jgi:hypothetical protein
MVKTTRAQREAVFKVFCRDQPYHEFGGMKYSGLNLIRRRRDYRQFRAKLQSGYGYVMLPWAGMWLGIETDGYTHS